MCDCTSPVAFFFNDTATTEIYTLSLHDALPIFANIKPRPERAFQSAPKNRSLFCPKSSADRKSTRLNSSHSQISYAVFCLKKNRKQTRHTQGSHIGLGQHRNVTRLSTPRALRATCGSASAHDRAPTASYSLSVFF